MKAETLGKIMLGTSVAGPLMYVLCTARIEAIILLCSIPALVMWVLFCLWMMGESKKEETK